MRPIGSQDIYDKGEKLGRGVKYGAKAIEEGKKLNLSEEELAFYDLLMSQEKIPRTFPR